MFHTQRAVYILVTIAALAAACGCSGDRTQIQAQGIFSPCRGQRCAVLRINSPRTGGAACAGFLWGWYDTTSGEQRFATMLTDAAAEVGLPVMKTWDAHNKLSDAGMEPTLQPAEKDLALYARTLGCDTYLGVDIDRWGYHYFLFSPRARLDFTLSCHSARSHQKLWTVRVESSRRGMTDLELAPLVLAEVAEYVARRSGTHAALEARR